MRGRGNIRVLLIILGEGEKSMKSLTLYSIAHLILVVIIVDILLCRISDHVADNLIHHANIAFVLLEIFIDGGYALIANKDEMLQVETLTL